MAQLLPIRQLNLYFSLFIFVCVEVNAPVNIFQICRDEAISFFILNCTFRVNVGRLLRTLDGIPAGLETRAPGYDFLSSSSQLSMKFQQLINTEIVKITGKFRFNTQQIVI